MEYNSLIISLRRENELHDKYLRAFNTKQYFTKEEMQELADQTPLGRLGNPDEVADLIEFLGSEKSNFITGQIITCDGGFTL